MKEIDDLEKRKIKLENEVCEQKAKIEAAEKKNKERKEVE